MPARGEGGAVASLAALAVTNALAAAVTRLRVLVLDEPPLSSEERAERAYEHLAWCQSRHCAMVRDDLLAIDEEG